MKTGTSTAVYFVKVAAGSFVSITVLAVLFGMALSAHSLATSARVSSGAFVLQGEDFFWIGVISVAIGAGAAVVRLARRGSRKP